jgi:Ribonuclease G/E
LAESLRAAGETVHVVRRFADDGWEELIAEALAGEVAFAGGTLQFSPTPAMLLVDIDGAASPRTLALAAVDPVAAAVWRFDFGGSIGLDFPSLPAKEDRRAVDEALSRALSGWPHERTAMNGFGFVQLVARLERISLLHRATFQRAEMCARWLLRRAEGLAGAGAIELAGNPSLEGRLKTEWLAELARRTGREVRWRADPGLALEAPHAQLVPR